LSLTIEELSPTPEPNHAKLKGKNIKLHPTLLELTGRQLGQGPLQLLEFGTIEVGSGVTSLKNLFKEYLRSG